MMKIKNDDKGFTLLEVVIAIVILAFVLTATAAFFFNSANQRDTAEERIAAANIAQGVIEGCRAESFSTLMSSTDTVAVAGDLARTFNVSTVVTEVDIRKISDVSGTITFDRQKLTQSSNVLTTPAVVGDPMAKFVVVTVSWGEGTANSLSMDTLILK